MIDRKTDIHKVAWEIFIAVFCLVISAAIIDTWQSQRQISADIATLTLRSSYLVSGQTRDSLAISVLEHRLDTLCAHMCTKEQQVYSRFYRLYNDRTGFDGSTGHGITNGLGPRN